MSVLIAGMKMPKCCAECDAEGHYENSYGDEYGFFCPFGYKAYTEKTRDAKRLDNCPLIPVPKHGRLIDGDALAAKCDSPYWCVWLSDIDNAHTIIPAEPAEEGEI